MTSLQNKNTDYPAPLVLHYVILIEQGNMTLEQVPSAVREETNKWFSFFATGKTFEKVQATNNVASETIGKGQVVNE